MAMKQKVVDIAIIMKEIGESTILRSGTTLASVGKLIGATATLITTIAVGAIASYRSYERTLNSLNQSLISAGIYTKDLSDEYQRNAQELSKTSIFSANEIKDAEAELQLFIGQNKITKPLIQAIIDFASAKRISLDAAVTVFGKSLGSNTNVLQRYGIALDENASVTDKAQQAIAQVERSMGGQGAAALQGLGSLSKVNQGFSRLLASLGKRLAPSVVAMAKQMTAFFYSLQNSEEALDAFLGVSQLLVKIAVIAKGVFVGFIGTFGILFRVISGGSQSLSEKIDQNFTAIDHHDQSIKEFLLTEYKKTKATLSDINTIEKQSKQDRDDNELARMQKNAETRLKSQRQFLESKKAYFDARSSKEIAEETALEAVRNSERLKSLNFSMTHEKNMSSRLEAEHEKRKLLNGVIIENEYRRTIALSKLRVMYAENQFGQLEHVLSIYAEMQNSKMRELVILGKSAAIASMVISGAMAAAATFAWVVAIPVVGVIMAPIMAGAVTAWYLEQIGRIRNSSLENPAVIAFGLNFGDIIAGVVNLITWFPQIVQSAIQLAGRVVNLVGSIFSEIGKTLGIFGLYFTALGAMFDFLGDALNVIGGIIGGFLDAIWPFAEGGFVSTPNFSEQSVVTPLKKLNPNMGRMGMDVHVKIVGGLIGTEAEAEKLATLIYAKAGG